MKQAQTFSILIGANKMQGQSGTMKRSLYARVTVNAKRSEISLKRQVDESQWDTVAGKVKGRTADVLNLNNYINEVNRELFNIYQQLSASDEFISADAIKNKFLGIAEEQRALLQTFQFHNQDYKKRIGIDVAKSTWVKFNTLESKLKAYVKDNLKKPDVYLQQLDYSFVTDFEYYLRSVEKTNSNTTMKYIRMMKKVMNDAVRKNWLDKNPFQAFKCIF